MGPLPPKHIINISYQILGFFSQKSLAIPCNEPGGSGARYFPTGWIVLGRGTTIAATQHPGHLMSRYLRMALYNKHLAKL